jgi:hypothetical protein
MQNENAIIFGGGKYHSDLLRQAKIRKSSGLTET